MNTITYSVGNNSVVVDQTPKIRCQFNPKLFGSGLVVGFDQKEIFENGTGIYPVFVKNHQAAISIGGSEKIFFSGEWADEIRDAGPIKYVVHVVGENNYKRDVYVFDIPGKINLRAGLTIHSGPGTWSSWPAGACRGSPGSGSQCRTSRRHRTCRPRCSPARCSSRRSRRSC